MNVFRYSLILIVLLCSCKKEIDIKLKDAAPRLVIVANYDVTDSLVTVRVSQSGSYFTPNSELKINTAIVTLYGPNGIPIVIPSIGDGNYSLFHSDIQVGAEYKMIVHYQNIDYEATSKLMTPMEGLSIYSAPFPAGQAGGPNYVIFYSFQDQIGLGNCYKVVETLNNERLDQITEIVIGTDKLSDGNAISVNKIGFYNAEDTVSFEIQSINEKTYQYYQELKTGTNPNTAAQGNPNSVWTNRALGYFSVYSTSTLSIVLE